MENRLWATSTSNCGRAPNHEWQQASFGRDSLLDCASPLELSVGRLRFEIARGLAQSKTWRQSARFTDRYAWSGFLLKFERGGIDAVTQAGGLGAVVENVAEVAAAF